MIGRNRANPRGPAMTRRQLRLRAARRVAQGQILESSLKRQQAQAGKLRDVKGGKGSPLELQEDVLTDNGCG